MSQPPRPRHRLRHLDLRREPAPPPFRRLAIASWHTAYDPTVYGTLQVRVDAALAHLEAERARTGVDAGLEHLVAQALCAALRSCPEANALLRFNRLYLRRAVAISFAVPDAAAGGALDVHVARLEDADLQPLADVVAALAAERARVAQARAVRAGRARGGAWAARLGRLLSFVLYTLNLRPRGLALPPDPFGGATVVDAGALGLDAAYVPLVPFTRVPLMVTLGRVREVPVVGAHGEVEVARVMDLCASFDHRFVDGYHAALVARTVREALEAPDRPPPGRAAAAPQLPG